MSEAEEREKTAPVEVVEEQERRRLSDEEIQELFMQWVRGEKSIRQISRETGIPKSTIAGWFKKLRMSGVNVDEVVEQAAKHVPAEIRDEYKRKLRAFLSMGEEERLELVRKSVEFFAAKAKRNPIQAVNLFAKWLTTPDGMIIFAYMWKPEYVEDVTTATAELLRMIARVM